MAELPGYGGFEERVLKSIDPDEVVNLTSRLVQFPSVCESPAAEVEISRFIEDYLRRLGLEVFVQDVPGAPTFPKTPPGPHPQILARLKGVGDGTIMMVGGHIDTEPVVHPECWTHDPFSGDVDREGGWIYGVGTVNMKQSVASFMSAIHAIVTSGVQLKGDLLFAGWVMEDIACIGSRYMAEHWSDFDVGRLPHVLLDGEPTGCSAATTHTGSARFTITTKGQLAHLSSRYLRHKDYQGRRQINAFEKMLKIIDGLKDVRRTFRYDRHQYIGDPVIGFGDIRTKVAGEGNRPILGSYECQLDMDCRYLPSQTAQTVKDDIERLIYNLSIEDPEMNAVVERWPYWYPATELPRDHHLLATLEEAHKRVFGEDLVVDIDTNGTSTDRRIDMWRYAGSDVSNFHAVGVAGVNYGAGSAPVTPDEGISILELVNHCKVSTLTMLELCRPEQM